MANGIENVFFVFVVVVVAVVVVVVGFSFLSCCIEKSVSVCIQSGQLHGFAALNEARERMP